MEVQGHQVNKYLGVAYVKVCVYIYIYIINIINYHHIYLQIRLKFLKLIFSKNKSE